MAITFNLGNSNNPRDFNIDTGSLLFANGNNVAYGEELPATGQLGQVFFLISDAYDESTELEDTKEFTNMVTFSYPNATGGNQIWIRNSAYSETSINFQPNYDANRGPNWIIGTGTNQADIDSFCFYFGRPAGSTFSSSSNGNIFKVSPNGKVELQKGDLGQRGDVYYYAYGNNGTNDTSIRFGIGTSGINRGIYDDVTGNWLIYRNDANTLKSGSSVVTLTSGSDRRLKNNISELTNVKDFYLGLNPVSFNYKEKSDYPSEKIYYGLIAQEVIENYKNNNIDYNEYQLIQTLDGYSPEATEILAKEAKEGELTNSAYIINYDQFHALHIQAIKEAYAEIAELKEEIRLLKEKLGD